MGLEIKNELRNIEERYEEKNVTVLSARDYGSRAKGLAGPDSDYDVRFIFIQDREDYIGSSYTDTIEASRGDAELNGWNIKKFRENVYGNGPMAIEFLTSQIVYYEQTELMNSFDRLESHVAERFKPVALIEHYRSMAAGNYFKYIEPTIHDGNGTSLKIINETDDYWVVEKHDSINDQMVPKDSDRFEKGKKDRVVKRNLLVLWSLFNARYVEETHEIPPRGFDVLASECHDKSLITDDTFMIAREMAHMKRTGDGMMDIGNPIKEYAESELQRDYDHEKHVVRGIEQDELASFVDDACQLN